MKIKKYYLVLTVAVVFCAAYSILQAQYETDNKPFSFKQPHPAFAGIDKLHVAVLQYNTQPGDEMLLLKQLEEQIREKLQLAGIELYTSNEESLLTASELRIYLNKLHLDNSQQSIFHIRTVLAREVCLKGEQNPVFKADIWKSIPVMQAVSEQDIPEKITDLVTGQVDSFIDIFKATNPIGWKSPDNNINENVSSKNPAEQPEKSINPSAIGYSYVASDSSEVFHKPECQWAQNISNENLITYKSREEAIKAGKRPCKTCNP